MKPVLKATDKLRAHKIHYNICNKINDTAFWLSENSNTHFN